jgi:hypothetical protein
MNPRHHKKTLADPGFPSICPRRFTLDLPGAAGRRWQADWDGKRIEVRAHLAIS